eukprot:gene19487-35455_t
MGTSMDEPPAPPPQQQQPTTAAGPPPRRAASDFATRGIAGEGAFRFESPPPCSQLEPASQPLFGPPASQPTPVRARHAPLSQPLPPAPRTPASQQPSQDLFALSRDEAFADTLFLADAAGKSCKELANGLQINSVHVKRTVHVKDTRDRE